MSGRKLCLIGQDSAAFSRLACGAGLLTGDARPRSLDVHVPDGISLAEGDAVTLSIAPRFLLRAAMLAYGLPLLSMLGVVGLAWVMGFAGSDLWSVAFSLLGLGAGIAAGRTLLRRVSEMGWSATVRVGRSTMVALAPGRRASRSICTPACSV